jgi:hypothetical protein
MRPCQPRFAESVLVVVSRQVAIWSNGTVTNWRASCATGSTKIEMAPVLVWFQPDPMAALDACVAKQPEPRRPRKRRGLPFCRAGLALRLVRIDHRRTDRAGPSRGASTWPIFSSAIRATIARERGSGVASTQRIPCRRINPRFCDGLDFSTMRDQRDLNGLCSFRPCFCALQRISSPN